LPFPDHLQGDSSSNGCILDDAGANAEAPMIRMRRINLLLLAAASIALFFMLRRIDWPALVHSFLQAGPYLPLLILPYALTSYFWTAAWRCLLVGEASQPSMHRLFFIRLAGDSLNQLTPTASLGGEPFKALRLQAAGIEWQEATASLVISKALMALGLVLYIFLGLALIPLALPHVSHRLAAFSCLGAVVLGGASMLFVVLQRRNPCVSFLKLLQRIGICPAFLLARKEDLASLDAKLSRFYREHPRAGWMALFFFFLGWLTHALEAYLIFWLLGHRIDLPVALCLDALAQLVAGLGFMIPASLGVQDGGNILLSLGFNLGTTLGAGFSILRRFREAFWLLLGLLFVVKEP
jgi:glycosyltransferase 2 family protein